MMNKDEKKRHLILHDKNIYKGLIILAVPLMLNNFIKTVHDIIDMYFVSEIPGFSSQAVSAISLTFPIFFTFLSLGIGLSAAGTALISQHIGSGQTEEARKYASNLVIIALIVGIVLNAISFISAPYIMKWMGTTGFVYENSVRYLLIRSFELPVLFVFFAFVSVRQASGDTVTPVIYGVVTMVVNIVLTPIFIQVLGFGVPGAAIATLIANVIIIPVGLLQLFHSKTGITISCKYLKLDPEIARNIIRIAIPASLGQAITSIGFIIMNAIIVSYGDQTVAAFSVGNRISSIILHPVMALGGVLATYMGQNIGNNNIPRAKETFKKAMILSIVLMTVGSYALLPFREFLAGFFIKDDPLALQLADNYMLYLLLGMPLMAIFQTFISTYTGTGNTKYTFILSITRLWFLRIPLVYFFKNMTDLGSTGIWYAMIISNIVIIVLGIILYAQVDYKPKIKEIKLEEQPE
jgi:putative MATE family efflux protein